MGTNDERAKLKRRIEREVRIQLQLNHPNIMLILEAHLDEDPPWFIMPLASDSYVNKIATDKASGVIDPEPWADFLAGIEKLHRLGYVHRDIKPQNILLLGDDWVLSDFGLILPTMRDTTVLTGIGSAYGSRNYAAPEQAMDFRNTPEQADIYALGCILHDLVEQNPARIPFAQIRCGGSYGPIIEKCTEVDPRRRFPNIASLRSVLFDVWRTASFDAPVGDVADAINSLVEAPDSIENWNMILQFLDECDDETEDLIMRAINTELILKAQQIDVLVFARIVTSMCKWAAGRAFEWGYVDVIGDRLVQAFHLSTNRLRCQIVLAAANFAVSHNRWHVMGQVGRMLNVDVEAGLIDRFLIELSIDDSLETKLRKIEDIVHWRRASWHKKIADFLNSRD